MWGVVQDEALRCLLRDPHPYPPPQGGGEFIERAGSSPAQVR